ncbi:MAG: hypothetical protein HFJ33_02155 [Clostridia bacterium]|nr:hypothetical protein [Clostridia bacterium]
MKHKKTERFVIENINTEIMQKESRQRKQDTRKELNLEQDMKIRRYVRRKIEEYRAEGNSKETTIERILEEKGIKQHFDYLTKNGVNLKKCFLGWLNELECSQPKSSYYDWKEEK